jgi:hypothetical protein
MPFLQQLPFMLLLMVLLLLLLPLLLPLLLCVSFCRPFMQQLLHSALEHLGSALSTAFASLPNAGTAAASSTAASSAAAAGCPVEALGQYFMDLVYLDAVLSKAGGLGSMLQVCGVRQVVQQMSALVHACGVP